MNIESATLIYHEYLKYNFTFSRKQGSSQTTFSSMKEFFHTYTNIFEYRRIFRGLGVFIYLSNKKLIHIFDMKTPKPRIMKKSLKIISVISIFAFMILWLLGKFVDFENFDITETANIFVIIYLLASLKYYQLDSLDKDATIKELKEKLGE